MNHLDAICPSTENLNSAVILRSSWDTSASCWRFQSRPTHGETRLFSSWEAAFLYIEELMARQTSSLAIGNES